MPMSTSPTRLSSNCRALVLSVLLGCSASAAQADDDHRRAARDVAIVPAHDDADERRYYDHNRDRDRNRDYNRYEPAGWWSVAVLRTHRDGRGDDSVRVPAGTRAIRLAAVDRRTEIIAVYLERGNGSEERLYALEGRLDGRGNAIAHLRRPLRGPARLHIVHAPVREGRRAQFELLALR